MSIESKAACEGISTEKFFQLIDCPEPIVAAIGEVEAAIAANGKEAEALRMYEKYDEGDAAFKEAVREFSDTIAMPAEQVVLALYARLLAGRTYAGYCRMGIPESVFVETMTGFSGLAMRGFRTYGYYSVPAEVYRNWYRHNIDMTLFRLGRLEFEPRAYSGPDNKLCREGDRVISVHIPASGELSEENCEASYERARDFFRRYFGMEKVVFHCASWLMDPQWGQLLDETSRIRGFQSHYEILRAESSVRGAARWLFNGYCEDPRDYPTDTSLRRLAVKLLLSGGTLNIGMGVRL